jgi:hypothetical protein
MLLYELTGWIDLEARFVTVRFDDDFIIVFPSHLNDLSCGCPLVNCPFNRRRERL